MASKIVGFNYTKLEAKDREAVQGHAREIKSLLKRTAANIIEIGDHLITVKEQLPYGMFRGWMYAEFRWNPTYASRIMQAARRFGELDCLDRFQSTALLYLAQNNINERAISEAVSQARSGEPISGVIAKDLIHRYSPRNGKLQANPNKIEALRVYLKRLVA